MWPSSDLGADAEDDALEARLLGVLADGQQRLVERQAGFDERRELARQQRQVESRNAPEQREVALRLAFARLDLGDLDRQQLPLAQELAHVTRRIAFENATMFLPAGVDGDVLIRAHQSLRVTRSTSSSVVSPARIFCTPSSRMLGVSVRA